MRVIIIDDSMEYMVLVRRWLARAYPEVEVTEYDLEQKGKPGPNFDWSLYDLVLLDYELGLNENGLDWLTEFSAKPDFPPAIMMTGAGDEYVAVQAVKRGAADYLRKSDLTSERLAAAVDAAIEACRPSRNRTANRALENDAKVIARLSWSSEFSPDGERIGHRFVRLIGQGASSRVYLAERIRDNLTVVLKIIDVDSIDDPVVLKRFVQEAELMSDINSPFVVKYYEHGFTKTYGYIAMEFFTHGDLKQRIEVGMAAEDALNYALHIAYGLEAIHDVGVIHRDLKPGNIMFRSDESLALADLGISKRFERSGEITEVGTVLGTPSYISPEQAQGQAADARSDLYSAGIMLFEMLAGHRPFTAESSSALLYQHVHMDIPRLPAGLGRYQRVIDRLLAKSPEQRYQSASELVANLEAVLR